MNTHKTFDIIADAPNPIGVILIGVGGTGYEVFRGLIKMDICLRNLGHAGLHVSVFDYKNVTHANTGRQLYTDAEIGLNKAQSLIAKANRAYGLSWDSYARKWEGELDSIVISCVDDVSTRRSVLDSLENTSGQDNHNGFCFYWMDFGNGKDYGQVVLGTNPALEFYRREMDTEEMNFIPMPHVFDEIPNLEEHEEPNEPSCSHRQALESQDLFINDILAVRGCNLLYNTIRKGETEINGIYINSENYNAKPIYL